MVCLHFSSCPECIEVDFLSWAICKASMADPHSPVWPLHSTRRMVPDYRQLTTIPKNRSQYMLSLRVGLFCLWGPFLGGYSTFWTRLVLEVGKSDFLGSDNHEAVNFANIFFFVFSNSLGHSNSDTERLPVRTHQSLVLLVQFVFSAQSFFLVVCSICHWWPWSQWPGPALPSLYNLFCSLCLTSLSPLILLILSPHADSLSPPYYFLPGTLPSAITSASWVMKRITLP